MLTSEWKLAVMFRTDTMLILWLASVSPPLLCALKDKYLENTIDNLNTLAFLMSPKPYSRPLLLILQLLIDPHIGPRQGYKQTKKPKQTNKRGKVYMSLVSWGFRLKQANKNKVNINTYKMKKKKHIALMY